MPSELPPLRRAAAADLALIMRIEREIGFERHVGRSSLEQHQAWLASPDCAYLVGQAAAGSPCGFALLRDLGHPHGNLCVKRLAVAPPGQGFGAPFLRAIVAWAFRETPAQRLWLDSFADNARAQHVYEKCGFVREGVMRSAYALPGGGRGDLVLMAILRGEWRG